MSKADETAQREQRLAAKLRENLRRRKDQARARAAGSAHQVEAPDEAGGQRPLKPGADSDS